MHVQYAPYRLAEGTWDVERRRALGDLVVEILAEHVPGLREATVSGEVLSPRDLEEAYGWSEGHAYQGELTLDQILFMRPVAGWARYRMPIWSQRAGYPVILRISPYSGRSFLYILV